MGLEVEVKGVKKKRGMCVVEEVLKMEIISDWQTEAHSSDVTKT